MLTREQILKADDLPHEEVPVPEWGGSVLVWTLTGAERDAFEEATLQKRGKRREADLSNIRARLAALAVRDADGKRLFGDSDVVALGRKSARALDRVFAVAQRLNGITDEDVEELEKNSAPARNGCAGTN